MDLIRGQAQYSKILTHRLERYERGQVNDSPLLITPEIYRQPQGDVNLREKHWEMTATGRSMTMF
jgi:hypothetical protein